INIGLQSINRKELAILGRVHTEKDFYDTFKTSRKAGFKNIGVDIIYGIPSQTSDLLKRTLMEIIKLYPEHISAYSLTFEEGTYLKKLLDNGNLKRLNDDKIREFYKATIKMLESSGYKQYEISNFSRPEYECLHNLNYWNLKPYLGFGLGAHTFDGKKRAWNTKIFSHYFSMLDKNKFPTEGKEVLTEEQKKIEMIMLGLRKSEGISINNFKIRFGIKETDNFMKKVSKLNIGEKFFKITDDNIYLTVEGKLIMDELVLMLI
ncbi:coproporphyrinogen III oxidase, partial [candidate division KSB1 bacterium]